MSKKFKIGDRVVISDPNAIYNGLYGMEGHEMVIQEINPLEEQLGIDSDWLDDYTYSYLGRDDKGVTWWAVSGQLSHVSILTKTISKNYKI